MQKTLFEFHYFYPRSSYYEKKIQTYVNQKQKGRKILGLGMFSHTITFLLPQ